MKPHTPTHVGFRNRPLTKHAYLIPKHKSEYTLFSSLLALTLLTLSHTPTNIPNNSPKAPNAERAAAVALQAAVGKLLVVAAVAVAAPLLAPTPARSLPCPLLLLHHYLQHSL